MKVKSDHRSKFSNLSNWKEKTESGITVTFLSRRIVHTFSCKETLSATDLRPHSEIPVCRILCNFTSLIWPHKPVTFIFPLLIFLILIKVSTFLKLYLKFRKHEKTLLVCKDLTPLMQAKFSWPFGYRVNGFQFNFELLLNAKNVIEEEENSDINSV